MFETAWPAEKIVVWPAGIDTQRWRPAEPAVKDVDVLVYDKIRWQREKFVPELLQPVMMELQRRKLRIAMIRYGSYREEEFEALLKDVVRWCFFVSTKPRGSRICKLSPATCPFSHGTKADTGRIRTISRTA